jgi:heptosyltransferase-1
VAAAALGYAVEGPADFNLGAPDLQPAWLPAQPYAVFFHGTARAGKQWPEADWIALGKRLTAHGLALLLPWGSAAEHEAARRIAAGVPGAQVLPRLPLMEAVTLAQRAALAVGVDTGLTHIAAAFERPTVELYCDSPRWKTEGNWSPRIVNLGDGGAPPDVEQAAAAALALLDRHPAC